MSSRRHSSLPKPLQDLVDKEEDELEEYGDYENSWTTTEAQSTSQATTDPEPSKVESKTEMAETKSETAGQQEQS
ncbi:hypothetical protein BDW42DRAFT_172606 [Aspergillus taichungensis]|uniref:Uncharacterized protein n=1 Tax=Aspergillus taichungensis TaxID=482145 RepID=A0A2J5HQR4_9EURO|nr:hypothetical protein BDW42DRAFT_172606 [Aspergillus taichungensis]